ncbi:hypothetical protein Hanom_Chr12g01108701 [Helianthus anomalus]
MFGDNVGRFDNIFSSFGGGSGRSYGSGGGVRSGTRKLSDLEINLSYHDKAPFNHSIFEICLLVDIGKYPYLMGQVALS